MQFVGYSAVVQWAFPTFQSGIPESRLNKSGLGIHDIGYSIQESAHVIKEIIIMSAYETGICVK